MKKISFSFTKSKASPIKRKTEPASDIQFIDCIESNAIKVKEVKQNEKEEELIISVKNGKPVKTEDTEVISEEPERSITVTSSKPVPTLGSPETLEAIAVREILEDSQNVKESAPLHTLNVLPASKAEATVKESTLEDYESVPVADFGMAMLRGMGWKPEKGIGKNEKVVEPTFPVLRPKGMGLGVEKKKLAIASSGESEDLALRKGAYVRVLAGSHKYTYGEVQSFDEDAGRVIIKPALGDSNISVNESMIQVVPVDEFKRSSRVLNQSKYEECKLREEADELSKRDPRSDSSEYKRRKKHDFQESNGRPFPGE